MKGLGEGRRERGAEGGREREMEERERPSWGKMKRAVFQWNRTRLATIRCGPCPSGKCWLANWKALPRQGRFLPAKRRTAKRPPPAHA